MFGALEFSDKMAGYGIQPIIGCELAVDFGDQDPSAAQCAGRGAGADRAAGGARARLPQPDAAELARVPGDADPSGAAHQVRMAGRRRRGPDRADRRPGRADLARRSLPASAALAAAALRPAGAACSATGSTSSCSATASRRSAGPKPALIDLAYAQRPAAGRDQRAVFRHRRRLRGPRRAALHRRAARLIAETDRRQLTPEHRFKTRAEMAVLFADLPEALASTVEIAERCAFRPRDAQADPAALHGRRGRRRRGQPRRRGARNCAARPRRGWQAR